VQYYDLLVHVIHAQGNLGGLHAAHGTVGYVDFVTVVAGHIPHNTYCHTLVEAPHECYFVEGVLHIISLGRNICVFMHLGIL
jgi:hypothetical protein